MPAYFPDIFPTLADLAGAKRLPPIDGQSILPTLLGQQQAFTDRYYYWEFHERGFQQAIRWNNWKAVRLGPGEPLELYDLSVDLGEENDVAVEQGKIVEMMENYLDRARTESVDWVGGE